MLLNRRNYILINYSWFNILKYHGIFFLMCHHRNMNNHIQSHIIFTNATNLYEKEIKIL